MPLGDSLSAGTRRTPPPVRQAAAGAGRAVTASRNGQRGPTDDAGGAAVVRLISAALVNSSGVGRRGRVVCE